ncbi:MAG: hypothetical protein LBC29_05285 [Propionibacteriaceae bacterium]|jgi:hypothetical protein|nr:hypothetical protein [Propionibacteriaceae bacterium]
MGDTDTARLVFVPVSVAAAQRVLAGETLCDVPAFRASAELAESFGIAESGAEAVEFAALTVAALAALTQYGERRVLVAEPPAELPNSVWESEALNGGIQLETLPAAYVTAFFCDADTAATAALIRTAAAVAQGLSVDDAWELPEVSALIDETDLLWHDITELSAYLAERIS